VTLTPLAVDLSGLASTALGIVALATAAGLGLMRGTVTNLREQLADTRADNAEMRISRVEDRALIDTQKAELAALAKIVTGEVHWQSISETLDHHHVEAKQHWTRAEGNTSQMLDALHDISRALDDRNPS
jgi:hypothetical protein